MPPLAHHDVAAYKCADVGCLHGFVRVLEAAVKLLAKAEELSNDKLERLQAQEVERRENKKALGAERQRVLAQIKDDHLAQ